MGKQRKESSGVIAKSTSHGILDMGFYACCIHSLPWVISEYFFRNSVLIQVKNCVRSRKCAGNFPPCCKDIMKRTSETVSCYSWCLYQNLNLQLIKTFKHFLLAQLATAEMLCASLTVILTFKRENVKSEKPDINAFLLAKKWIMHRQHPISLARIWRDLKCRVWLFILWPELSTADLTIMVRLTWYSTCSTCLTEAIEGCGQAWLTCSSSFLWGVAVDIENPWHIDLDGVEICSH